ncbi:MAG: hypothetical protein AAGA77_07180 [Bacteroidota bacterium]
MEDRVKQFLESGKLEEYVFGLLDSKDEKDVLSYIKQYPAVASEYQVLQDQLETLSIKQSIKAPAGMKSQILDALPDKTVSSPSSSFPWTTLIAITGIAASLILGWLWNSTTQQLYVEKQNYATLVADCEERTKSMEAQSELIAFYNSAKTQRHNMTGNQLAPNFNAIVFVNTSAQKAILTPTQELSLPEGKCLQLWGDLEGEMIPIAVLNEVTNRDYALEINPEFTSLNFTIEDKTADGKGQDHPDVSQLISSVII